MTDAGYTHFDPVEAGAICHTECAIAEIVRLRAERDALAAAMPSEGADAALAYAAMKTRAEALAAKVARQIEDGPTVFRRDGTQCSMRQWAVEQKQCAEAAEAECAVLRKLLLRWLQLTNLAKRDTGATVADWDKLRQESNAALASKESHD